MHSADAPHIVHQIDMILRRSIEPAAARRLALVGEDIVGHSLLNVVRASATRAQSAIHRQALERLGGRVR